MTPNPIAVRVAQRFAAKRPMKPEKLQALMLKLRKGQGTSVKINDLMPVFEHLGGWTFEPMFYLAQQGVSSYDPHGQGIRTFRSTGPGKYTEESIRGFWEEKKRREVAHLPSNDQLGPSDENKSFYMDVSEIQADPDKGAFFTYKEWRVAEGTRVIAPNRESFEGKSLPALFLGSYLSNEWSLQGERLANWLKEKSPFYDQLNKALGTEGFEIEQQKKRDETRRLRKIRYNLGVCPCCFNDFKLDPRTKYGKDKTMPGMVLHGYQRPGTGEIYGKCFGRGWPPFELSHEGTDAFIVVLEKHEVAMERALKRLEKVEKYDPEFFGWKSFEGPIHPKEWEKRYNDLLRETTGDLDQTRVALATLRRHRTGWKPRPLFEDQLQDIMQGKG